MVHVDNFPRAIPMPRSCLLQLPVEGRLLCSGTWPLTLQSLLLLGTLFDAPTERAIARWRNMARSCLLLKKEVDRSHRLLLQRFVVFSDVLLKQGILLIIESRKAITALVPLRDESQKSMSIDSFCRTPRFTPTTQCSCGNSFLNGIGPSKQFVALCCHLKLPGTCFSE